MGANKQNKQRGTKQHSAYFDHTPTCNLHYLIFLLPSLSLPPLLGCVRGRGKRGKKIREENRRERGLIQMTGNYFVLNLTTKTKIKQ
jgi:hypothetical protein